MESACEVGKEGNANLVHKTSESSINRTPKSEINQPGKIFTASATRNNSKGCEEKAESNTEYTQPKIMNFNSRFG
jgi:hypothetical protein